MNKLALIKNTVSFVATIGVGAVVGNAVKHTTPGDLKKVSKVAVLIGGFVVGSMVNDAATKYAEKQVDDIAEAAQTVKDATREAKESFRQASEAAAGTRYETVQGEVVEDEPEVDHQPGDSFRK